MKPTQPAKRLPENYQIILDVVREQGRGHHGTVSDIFSAARRRQPRLGYATVYRALERLGTLGLVAAVRIPGTGSALYEAVGSNHAHFVCDGCGKVEDIAYTPPASVMDELVAGRDLEVMGVSVTLHGRCGACRSERPA